LAEGENSQFTDKTSFSLKTFNRSHSSGIYIAKVFTYLRQEHSATNTHMYKQFLSQRVYNPKKRRTKAPSYRSGLTWFGSCLPRIYVAKN